MKSKVTFMFAISFILCVMPSCITIFSSKRDASLEPVTLQSVSGDFSVGMRRYLFQEAGRVDPFIGN